MSYKREYIPCPYGCGWNAFHDKTLTSDESKRVVKTYSCINLHVTVVIDGEIFMDEIFMETMAAESSN